MPFIAKHVRLTNSGKLPDLFLTARIQSPADLGDAALGKLYFVLQINLPWGHASPIGSSIINVVSREYYRQEGSVPLENFERAIAKANRLIEQLVRDGENRLPENFHALIGLAVGDEFHIAYTGEAEAYFLREGKLNLITEPGLQRGETHQTFTNLITGEISADDLILLGSPGLYGALTTDELELILRDPLPESSLNLGRRLKSLKARRVNAILLQFMTVKTAENTPMRHDRETVYLDQPIDSFLTVAGYNLAKIGRPLWRGIVWSGKKLKPKAKPKPVVTTVEPVPTEPAYVTVKENTGKVVEPSPSPPEAKAKFALPKLPTLPALPKLPKFAKLPGLPKLSTLVESEEAGVPIHHYGSRRTGRLSVKITHYLMTPLKIIQDIGLQFRRAFRRSPQTWYIVISLLLLSSIGASIQTHKTKTKDHPQATTATLDEMKDLLSQAKQSRVYGDNTKARQLYSEAIKKGQQAKSNAKLQGQATTLIASAKKELFGLAGVTELNGLTPLLTLPTTITNGTVYEGVLYYTTSDGKLVSSMLTGGDPVTLAQLPNAQASSQILVQPNLKNIYLQTYTGELFHYNLTTKKLKTDQPASGVFPVSTGLGFFNDVLYMIDPAADQIWKYTASASGFSESAPYLKSKKIDLQNSQNLAIDGSIFVLHKDGQVTKFARGAMTTFAVNSIPAPYDKISHPLNFFADADGYYLTDRGDATTPARLIELDRTGKFVHQFFFPADWQKSIKLIVANPKSHKAWVVVNRELYEFTLVQ